MGAGPVPVDPHRRRPPIPIVPVDGAARDAAIARGATPAEAWLSAVTGDPDGRARVRVVDAGDAEVLRTTLVTRRDTPGMSVGEVALAVDTGRALAAAAADDGVSLLIARAPAGRDESAARAVADAFTAGSEHGPLGVLRRLGDATTAVLCGVALGAGEHGLGCVCDDVTALAGAAVAAGIEPDLRPRLATGAETAAEPLAAHLDHLAVAP